PHPPIPPFPTRRSSDLAPDPPGPHAHDHLLDHRHPAAVRRAAPAADHERRHHLGVHPEHVRLCLRVPVQRHRHGRSAVRDHRGRRLPALGHRAGHLELDGEASMSTTDNAPTHRAKPLGNAAKAARGDGRSGTRDAGRKPTTTIIVTAVLALVAVYFLVPVYWVVI